MLEDCKWDAQVADVSVLASFPLVMKPRVWTQLSAWAEGMAAELFDAEAELLARGDLRAALGMPAALERLFSAVPAGDARGARILRFDFHWTDEGWRVSEVNSDVPGGYSESTAFTRAVAAHYSACHTCGTPGLAWADALAEATPRGGKVVLLAAPGYLEDLQVVAYLACRLRERGMRATTATPEQIAWDASGARVADGSHCVRVDHIVRFYQAEWLAQGKAPAGWENYFRATSTVVSNPGCAVLLESKRLPMLWDRLSSRMPLCRRLFPQTYDPRNAGWREGDAWILKAAYGNTGDTVAAPGWVTPERWRQVEREVHRAPHAWVAQRRFRTRAIATPVGERYPCLGVYTVNGRAAGVYARLAHGPLVDFRAEEAAFLTEDGA